MKQLFMWNSDEVFPGLRDIDISADNVIECYDRADGEFNAFYGLKQTEEVKQEHSEFMKGYWKTHDTSICSINKIGKPGGRLGQKNSEEHNSKISENHIRPMKDKKFSIETKRKMSEKRKLWHKNNPDFCTSERMSKISNSRVRKPLTKHQKPDIMVIK